MKKRIFDVLGACVFLVVFAPLMILIALAVWIMSGRPVFFKQERLGYKEKPFLLLKFRSMINGADQFPELILGENERITGIGKYLRKTHLDELPQLWNVLKGDMSLVGPRPLTRFGLYHLMQNCERFKERFEVKPGLTGQTQIHGRIWILGNFRSAMALEVDYVRQCNLLLDFKIILKTALVVLRRQGV